MLGFDNQMIGLLKFNLKKENLSEVSQRNLVNPPIGNFPMIGIKSGL
jgi:hypothetical protein